MNNLTNATAIGATGSYRCNWNSRKYRLLLGIAGPTGSTGATGVAWCKLEQLTNSKNGAGPRTPTACYTWSQGFHLHYETEQE